jgi:hypothetical protein
MRTVSRGRGRGHGGSTSPHLAHVRRVRGLRRPSHGSHARFVASTSRSSLRTLPRTPQYLQWPRTRCLRAACWALPGWCRGRRHQSSRACLARLRLARLVLPPIPPRPCRDRAPSHGKPQKSKGAGPVPRCCPCGGRPKGQRRGLSGWRARPKRPRRFSRPARPRRASSSRSKPMRQASPYRLRVAVPRSRGFPAVSHDRAST